MVSEGKDLSEDRKLEYLKQKRLLEMQRHVLAETAVELRPEKEEVQKTIDPKEVLKTIFAENAWKIWRAAEYQYPQAAKEVAKALANLVKAGKITATVTGTQLYWLFTEMGLRVRVETKIRILDKGELKTIADKLHET